MPDKEYRIKIYTVAETSGAEQAKQAQENLTGAVKAGAEATEGHHKSFLHAESSGRLFHGILHKITEQSPLMGEALRLALSPQAAALFAVTLLLRHYAESQEQAKKAAEETAAASATAFTEMADGAAKVEEAATQAATAFAREFNELGAQQHSAAKQTEEAVKAIDTERDAIKRLLAAHEELELSQTTDPIARLTIKRRYKDASASEDVEALKATLQAKQRELDAALGQREKLRQATATAVENDSGPKGAQVRQDAAAREQDRVRLEDQVKKFQIEADKLAGGNIAKWTAAVDKLDQAKIALAETLRIKSEDDEKTAASAAAVEKARKAELTNEGVIQTRQAEIPGLGSQFRIQSSLGTVESGSGNFADLQEQFRGVSTKLTHAAGALDITGFSNALIQLSTLPVMMGMLTKSINQATEGVRREIEQLNQRTQGQTDSRLRTTPGSG